jgi:hypothetical protein
MLMDNGIMNGQLTTGLNGLLKDEIRYKMNVKCLDNENLISRVGTLD